MNAQAIAEQILAVHWDHISKSPLQNDPVG